MQNHSNRMAFPSWNLKLLSATQNTELSNIRVLLLCTFITGLFLTHWKETAHTDYSANKLREITCNFVLLNYSAVFRLKNGTVQAYRLPCTQFFCIVSWVDKIMGEQGIAVTLPVFLVLHHKTQGKVCPLSKTARDSPSQLRTQHEWSWYLLVSAL